MSRMNAILLVLSISLACSSAQNDTDYTPAPTPPKPKAYRVTFDETDSAPECSMRFNKFEGAYLRGVKSPNLRSFNKTTFTQCQKRCCYESDFCQSFSYFRPLRQCFIMNLTKENKKVELIDVRGYVHIQLLEYIDPTTIPEITTFVPGEKTTSVDETTIADETTFHEDTTSSEETTTSKQTTVSEETTTEFTTTELQKTTEPLWQDTTASDTQTDEDIDGSGGFIVVPGGDFRTEFEPEGSTSVVVTTTTQKTKTPGPGKGILTETEGPEKMISDQCPMECQNEGECRFRPKSDGSSGEEAYCECQKGFGGDACETTVIKEGGFPMWSIAIIVIGALIIILVIVLCVLLQIYKRKKGEYKVVEHFRRWVRLGKKPKKSEIAESARVEEGNATSQTTSVQSIQNSNVSASSKSTV